MPALTSPMAWRGCDGCDRVRAAEMFARGLHELGAGPSPDRFSQTVMRNGPWHRSRGGEQLPPKPHQQAGAECRVAAQQASQDLPLAPPAGTGSAILDFFFVVVAHQSAATWPTRRRAASEDRECVQSIWPTPPAGERGRRSGIVGMDRGACGCWPSVRYPEGLLNSEPPRSRQLCARCLHRLLQHGEGCISLAPAQITDHGPAEAADIAHQEHVEFARRARPGMRVHAARLWWPTAPTSC